MFDMAGSSIQVSLVQVTRQLGWSAFINVFVVVVTHLILVLLVINDAPTLWTPRPFSNPMGLYLTAPWVRYRRLDQGGGRGGR